MATPTQPTLAIHSRPLEAGGGRPSDAAAINTVTDLSPHMRSILRKIYESYKLSQSTPPFDSDATPFTSYADLENWFRTSPSASALAPPPEHDLSYPISNYFIASSHNTYLSGNQFYGSSTGEAYHNVLIRGCRCLEIDVWDGEDDASSVSSSDVEEANAKHHKVRSEGRRERSNSKLSRFTHRIKEKASALRSDSRSPSRGHAELTKHNLAASNSHVDSAQTSGTLLTAAEVQQLRTEPRVKHGYTLTKDIPFRTVCHAIRDSAFDETNDLPVIVSLEVHCSLSQQEVMVEILRSVFQDYLVDISNEKAGDIDTLPSPDQLRNKILIKVKWSPDAETGESNDPSHHLQKVESTSLDTQSTDEEKKAFKILRALSKLGVYTRAYSFKHFDQPEARIPTHVFSLNEAKVEDIHADPQHGPALFEHNRNFLMRVFPSGLRVNSSNVEPCFLWRQGAQMVALNWQKLDRGMMLNEGMFAGEKGWVLKPTGFRGTSAKQEDGQSSKPLPKRQLLDLEIELIAAQDLPLPLEKEPSHLSKMKPYVKMQLHVDTHGPPGQGSTSTSYSHSQATSRYTPHRHKQLDDDDDDDESRKLKRKSKTGKSGGPDFGGEILRWSGIHDVVDELSFLRLKIHDDRTIGSDDLIAWACIKLSRLRSGYKFIHLLDGNGSPSAGVLLVRITKVLKSV